MLRWPDKDPNEKLDYQLDWSSRLESGDIISSSAWTVPSGITKVTDSFYGSSTTIWLSGGTSNVEYVFANTIETSGGRIMEEAVTLNVKSK